MLISYVWERFDIRVGGKLHVLTFSLLLKLVAMQQNIC